MVPFPLGFSALSFRPSLMDQKLSPELHAYQPADVPSRVDCKALLRVRVGTFLRTPFTWSTFSAVLRVGVLASSSLLAH